MKKKVGFLLVFVTVAFAAVDINDFFPFGEANGDEYLESGDDTSSFNMSISTNFNFFNFCSENSKKLYSGRCNCLGEDTNLYSDSS